MRPAPAQAPSRRVDGRAEVLVQESVERLRLIAVEINSGR
jgi:hypothetical protein